MPAKSNSHNRDTLSWKAGRSPDSAEFLYYSAHAIPEMRVDLILPPAQD